MATSNLGLTTLASADLLSAFPAAFNADMAILDGAFVKGARNPITSTSDDTPNYWAANIASGFYWFNQYYLTGQPYQYFTVLHFCYNTEISQIGFSAASGRTYRRVGSTVRGTAWDTPWIALDNSGDLLWTNSNPTSSFAGQTVSLDLSDYKFVDIQFFLRTDYTVSTQLVRFEVGSLSWYGTPIADANNVAWRQTQVTTSGVTFADASRGTTSGSSVNNNMLIPKYIYGIV